MTLVARGRLRNFADDEIAALHAYLVAAAARRAELARSVLVRCAQPMLAKAFAEPPACATSSLTSSLPRCADPRVILRNQNKTDTRIRPVPMFPPSATAQHCLFRVLISFPGHYFAFRLRVERSSATLGASSEGA